MNSTSRKLTCSIVSVLFIFFASATLSAQDLFMKYEYLMDLKDATQAPEFQEFPRVEYPDSARKNGVEGTCSVSFTLAEDGTVKNIEIKRSLSPDVDDAVKTAVQKMRFTPAKRNGTPIAVTMGYDFIVTATFDERDSSVGKPKITFQPEPVYPEKYRADKLKDKVYVTVLFNADGTLKVVGVSSTMPKEFDKAAIECAEQIKFEPAVHKKSKKKITLKMMIEIKFKP
ncbi:MAG: TonB family protein [Pyrinomonadaceae bacterium]